MPSIVYDGIRLEIPRPAQREPVLRTYDSAPPSADETGLDVSRDLAPARGILTAVGVGTVLWGAILATLLTLLP